MDIRDFLKPSPEDQADRVEAASAMKAVFDSWIQVGFTRKEALQMLCVMMETQMKTSAETEFSERLARGEFGGDN